MPVSISEILSTHWIVIILGFLMALSITSFTIPSIVNISRENNLCTIINGRTSHKNSVPTLGGKAVFTGSVIPTVIYAGKYFNFELQYSICRLIIVFFLGIKDDILIIDS
jgi:UDP-N-acetylmuramyl pentapeptide phosphotransferase/UDP-N-acetylglucosamine-1-phosphate transferase